MQGNTTLKPHPKASARMLSGAWYTPRKRGA